MVNVYPSDRSPRPPEVKRPPKLGKTKKQNSVIGSILGSAFEPRSKFESREFGSLSEDGGFDLQLQQQLRQQSIDEGVILCPW